MKTSCGIYVSYRIAMVWIHICAAIALTLFNCLTTQLAMASPQQQHVRGQRIPGHAVPLLEGLTPIGPTAKVQPLHLTVLLKLHDEANLDALLAAQNNPTSPQYHHYLSTQEFNSQFAPTQAEVAVVVAYLRQQRIRINSIAANRLLIDTSTTVATAEQAFAININNYQLQTRVIYAPNVDPYVPDTVNTIIKNITGLNNVAHYRPINLQQRLRPLHPHRGPKGGFTPQELRSAYDVTPLIDAKMDGRGQTVGLFELDGYNPADIATYRQQYQLGPLNASNVLVGGASDRAGPNALEVTLDIEVISAMAPGAAQKVYIGPNDSAGINDTYNRIVTDNVAKVISVSWGECELGSSASRLDTLNTIFKQGAAQGQTFFAASGDSGAYDCNDSGIQSLAVDSPANNPYVVGVGGTTLRTDPKGVYVSEVGWGGSQLGGLLHITGSGGGKSMHFLSPDYQSGINLTDPQRQIPDVSANADPATGYSIYRTPKNPKDPAWQVVGGTSAAAPLWAGIATDINQALLASKLSPLGHALPALYRLYNTPQVYPPYHDIIKGSNLYYQAGPNYDLVTGMGTPDAWNILRDLQSSPGLPTQLLQNGGFESGMTPWQEHSGGGFELISTANPHTSKHAAYLCGYANCHDTITQTVLIPAFARRLTLDYWIYIGRGDTSTTCQDNLQIIFQTATGDPINQVQKLCNTDANGWVQYNFDVTAPLTKYVGQKIQVAFEASGTSGPRSNFFVDLDDVNLTSLAVTPGITTQLIQNQNFITGQAPPWQESSKGGYEIVSSANPHTGKYSAYLCGYPNCVDTIVQTVNLPASTRNAVLSYWVYIGRADTTTTCTDTFQAFVRPPGSPSAPTSSTDTEIQKLCNTDANGWVQYSFDITATLVPYLGKPVQVGFRTIGSSNPRSNFFVNVDDVSLYVTHT
ncbi:hypothetical protein KDA_42580 [Dictyobacter alpinus]|uniref:Peptidase S53 domain-containing protein n=1 Tax=Dictyobacter alpinus TaxID=2014873 RepID=A0A402BBR8_9CHLR|nr:S53 family peptidase [Dictyobacter alpinus]GCE28774.1 hypothetical protein KDA_42580 [Dictyobacter alpinus]